MNHTSATVLTLLAVVLSAARTQATGQEGLVPTPVLASPTKVISLHRPSENWKVVTTIVLAIQPTTSAAKPVTFRWTAPNQNGTIRCGDKEATEREVQLPVGTTSVACSYQPAVGFKGVETFAHDARFEGGAYAQQIPVTIEVRERGLRWEFKTNAATITSDLKDPESLKTIPEVLGGTSQDFLFSVNWQTISPSSGVENAPAIEGTPLLRKADLSVRPGAATQVANVLLETGVQSEAVAAAVVDIGPSATSAAPAAPSTGVATEETVARRNFVFRGEINYNAGINADRVGRFVEVGVVGRGSFTTVLDSDESFKEAVGRVLQVVPTDRSAYRWEGGVRLAVKRAHESDTTLLVKGDQLESASNIENAVLLEFTVRADSAFSSSGDDAGRDDRKRWAFRAELAPEIGILPGHQAPSFGFEVSRSFDGGPPAVKFLYGVSLSASKGIFKQ